MAWLPACITPILRLIKCVVPGLEAWAFALRRQRSHVPIVSDAPVYFCFFSAICATGLKFQLCVIRVRKRFWKNSRERR
jgi:hypothetical protein